MGNCGETRSIVGWRIYTFSQIFMQPKKRSIVNNNELKLKMPPYHIVKKNYT